MSDLEVLNRCRLCSSQSNLTEIFCLTANEELIQMIYECTSIQITYENDFPCAVCTSCIRIIKQFYAYRRKCLAYNRELKRMRIDENYDNEFGQDPLEANSISHDGQQCYEELRKQLKRFLDTQVKEIEQKALKKVDVALQKHKLKTVSENALMTTVEPDTMEYEASNEIASERECTLDEQRMDCKLELQSVCFDSSDQEESELAGSDESVEWDQPHCVTLMNSNGRTTRAKSIRSIKKRQAFSTPSTTAAIPKNSKTLEEQLSEAQKKIDTLMQLHASVTGVVTARFTDADDIPISVRELEEINNRSSSDSVFVGLLITRLVDPENLKNMSVTGHASPRFAKLKKPDGSPLYPPTEKIDSRILHFICNKVAERTAIKNGPNAIDIIRKNSDERNIKRYIAMKISNLKKSDSYKRIRLDGETDTE